jgi:MYXO-CTERM domain-containing protein
MGIEHWTELIPPAASVLIMGALVVGAAWAIRRERK